MPSNHLILCHPLLLLPSVFPSIRVFSNESALLIKWPKYWSFSFNISPSNFQAKINSLVLNTSLEVLLNAFSHGYEEQVGALGFRALGGSGASLGPGVP